MFRQTYSDGRNVYSIYMIHRYVNENTMEVQKIPLSRLSHTRDWKMWGDWNGDPTTSERWSINDVLRNPETYPRDYANILKADLRNRRLYAA